MGKKRIQKRIQVQKIFDTFFVVYKGIIPTPSLMFNNLNLKVMANNCTIKLNSRGKICLCFKNSTPFVIEGKVINPPYVVLTKGKRETASYLGIDLNGIQLKTKDIFKAKSYFDRTLCGSVADSNNNKLGKFLDACNYVITTHPDKFKTASEIGTFVLGGCKEESLNPSISLGNFIDIIIDSQRNKVENPDSMNYQLYKGLKNSLKDWEGGNKLNQQISTLFQADYDNLSKYLKERRGTNGKKGANWEKLMKCYKAVINAAISPRYNKVTGCNETNCVKLDKQNPKTQFKQRTGKTFVELYNEKKIQGALTFEQVEAFKRINPSTLIVRLEARHNNKTYSYTLDKEKVCLCYDILLFMLSTGGIRPIDAIRISHINFDFDNNQIVYLPAKKNRFANDDNELSKHLVSVPLNNDNLGIFEKYKNCDANGFLFPCPCNIEDKGHYNYKRINQFEAYMNAVIKEIGKTLNLDFVPTNYTMRKTAITYNVDKELESLRNAATIKAARLAGTSTFHVKDTYYKQVNRMN